MRVLMIHTFHHPRGGDSTYTRSLTGLLENAGHTVAHLAMRHPDNEPSTWEARFPAWVDLRQSRGRLANAAQAMRMVWSREAAESCAALIADFKPDVAHLQHVHRHLTPSVLDPLNAAGVPVVWTVHDYELICPSGHLFTAGAPCERCRNGDYRNAIRQRCKWGALLPSAAVALEQTIHRKKNVWGRVDRFLCPSRFLAGRLEAFGVPADRITPLNNPLDLTVHPPATAPGQGWLYAGRLAEEKGVEIVIEAARQLPTHPLRICGDGPIAADLRRQAAGMSHVSFLGHLPTDQLAGEIRRAAVIAVPSRWYENFPYAVLEAQAASRAVVASAIGGIPEQIESGVNGLLVPPSDPAAMAAAVGSLLADPDAALRMGRAARQRIAERLNPADHLATVESIYREVCAR
ncbi:MAG: glycosyltransferase [Myxococcota bacterium]|nr:glycosyltransferase [Myxococcota bacterium]